MVYKTLSKKKAASCGLTIEGHGISYHQQESHTRELYCGAASAQMILDSIGAGLIDQTELYNSCETYCSADPEGAWYTAPDILECTLNERKPDTFPAFKLWDLPSADAISRKLCWSIEHHGVAPIALIRGGSHWIVVVAYEATAKPKCSTDADYDIIKFEFFDPGPPTSAPPPPPLHGGPSDYCGMGDFKGFNRGYQDTEIYYKEGTSQHYEEQYWHMCTMDLVDTGTWEGKYLAICDPDPAPDTVDPILFYEERSALDPGLIRDRAAQWFYDLGRKEGDRRAPELAGLRAGAPLLVEREDLIRPLIYYIVPFSREAGNVRLAAYVNPYGLGGVAEVIAAPEGTTHFSRILNRDDVIRRFAGQHVEVDGHKVRLKAGNLHERLVWRPCAESLSPFWPFYRFDADMPGGRQAPVYVRIDGAQFTELHEGQGPGSTNDRGE